MKPENEGEYFKKILMDFFNQTGGSEEMEKAKEHDGCMDCVHVDLASDDYPCSECSCNYTDKYEKREEAKELTRSQIREMISRLYADILTDMQICEVEGWDKMEYIRMLQELINSFTDKESKTE